MNRDVLLDLLSGLLADPVLLGLSVDDEADGGNGKAGFPGDFLNGFWHARSRSICGDGGVAKPLNFRSIPESGLHAPSGLVHAFLRFLPKRF